MALTAFQRDVVQLISKVRIASGESYVAGGAALNTVLPAPRLSRDLDLFHDTEEALRETWHSDREFLEAHGFAFDEVHERPGYVKAVARRGTDVLAIEWVRDSAYRFFPLVTHPELGLTLHPVDLATNKVLALVGRVEVRDWVDAIECSERLQPLGSLAWAACGKDPGFSPDGIVEAAARSSRYTRAEVAPLSFEGEPPDVGALSRRWRACLDEARLIVEALSTAPVGTVVLDAAGALHRGDAAALAADLAAGRLRFHEGAIRGVLPRLIAP